MRSDLRAFVETTHLDATRIAAATRAIRERVLAASPYLDRANFPRIHTSDLERLFGEYDDRFFVGRVRDALGPHPLGFRLSRRMTRAAGQTTERRSRARPEVRLYEIAVSTTLLFQCFAGADHRPITVTRHACADRLEALQRIMEHEIVHLVERLVWGGSSCSAGRFQSIAARFFGHTGHTHELITPAEHALASFGIKPGDRVRFRYEGVAHTGFVNRITKRATVLVRDPSGQPFTDGHRYATYYIPVDVLERVETGRSEGR